MQHAAIFEKKSVRFEEGSLDHVRFYANEKGGNEGKEVHGKVPGLPRKVSCSHCGSRLADGMALERVSNLKREETCLLHFLRHSSSRLVYPRHFFRHIISSIPNDYLI